MRSPTMPMSARYHGAPVPSTTRPLAITTSNASLVVAAGADGCWHAAHTAIAQTSSTVRIIGMCESYVESTTDVELPLADAGVCDRRPRAVRDAGRARSDRDHRWRGALRDAAAMAGAGRLHLPGGARPGDHRPPQSAAWQQHRDPAPVARPGAAAVRARDLAAAVYAGAARPVAGP